MGRNPLIKLGCAVQTTGTTSLLDMLAAVARKDYDDRRRRQAQGIARAKLENKYKGRPDNLKLQSQIEGLLRDGKSYSYIIDLLKCGRATIAKVSKRIKSEDDIKHESDTRRDSVVS